MAENRNTVTWPRPACRLFETGAKEGRLASLEAAWADAMRNWSVFFTANVSGQQNGFNLTLLELPNLLALLGWLAGLLKQDTSTAEMSAAPPDPLSNSWLA